MTWRSEIAAEFTRRQKTVADDVVEELTQHAAAAYEAARADGDSPEAAAAQVRALVTSWCEGTGGPRRIQRALLPAPSPAGRSWFAGLGLDIRLAARLLRQEPGFAFISIAMITLGIAAATTIFAVVNGVLLKPLSWPGADRLIRVTETRRAGSVEETGTLSNLAYRAWQASPRTIEGLGCWENSWNRMLETGGRVEPVVLTNITASLFPLLGTAPLLGIGFTVEQEVSASVVLLSHSFWQERLGGAPDVLGRAVTINGSAFTVVGVMPRDFAFPDRDTQVWMPFTPGPQRTCHVIARLADHATPTQAAAEAQARLRGAPLVNAQLTARYGDNRQARVTAVLLIDAVTEDVKPALLVMLAAVALLFAAAVGNVANMQLARAMRRQKDIAIRTAIGAGSGRLARQLLVETSMLATIGGLLGIALTLALLRGLPRVLPTDFPRAESIAADPAALIVALGLAALVVVATGVMPMRVARLLSVNRLLADGGAAVGHSLRSPLARSRVVIITAQVAIAALLLVGAALLAQSFAAMLNVDRGYVPERVTTARVVLSSPGTSPAQRTAALNELLDRLRAIPNVAAAAFTTDLPPAPARGSFGFHGTYRRRAYAIDAQIRFVSPGFFEAVGMRLEGRGYARTDTLESEPVIVVNRAFARSFLGGAGLDARPPVGLDEDRPNLPPEWRVIGIVDDVRQSATETVKPEVYACVCQITRGPDKVQFIVARTIGGTPLATSTIHQLVHDINPAAVVDQVRTLDASARNDISRPRLYAALLGAFAVFALLVSVIGLYGGLSYGVTQRTQEIGVRAALGATPADIVMLVVKQGGAMTLAGLACGLGVAAVGVRYLGAFLFGVAPYDFVSFSGVAVTLIAAGMVACIVPAIRAVRIDAIEALRRS